MFLNKNIQICYLKQIHVLIIKYIYVDYFKVVALLGIEPKF